ncbi:hypothetical protein ACIPJU_05400 [Micrococcus endophyticus]|uniref:hypothetical protein n=1 Tax=Micrococcus endophyticus TaxID=455343 RepID=UPI0038061645
MPSTTDRAARTGATHTTRDRLVWVDVARGLALVSMMVAHVAPTGGPAGILNLSEHLTAALFAALVGVSACLEATRFGLGRALVRALIRAAALLGAAWLTSLFGAAVVDILTHLAVVTVFMALLAALPLAVHLVLALLAGGGGILLAQTGSARVVDALAPAASALGLDPAGLHRWTSFLVVDGPYRLPLLLAWALLGAVLVRTVHGTTTALPRSGRLVGLGWGVGGVVLAGLVILLSRVQTGAAPVPYTGTAAEILVDTGLVLGVLGLCAAVVPSRPSPATDLLAVPGSMTLSVYVAHQAYLGWVLTAGPGPWVDGRGADDTWFNLAVLLAGGILLPLLWRGLVRVRPFRVGPLEGVVRLVTDPIGRRSRGEH